MALFDFLQEGAQERYLPSIKIIAERWDIMLGEDALDGVNDYNFAERVISLLESGKYRADFILQVISDLGSIAWWRGPHLSDGHAGRVAALARRLHLSGADALTLPPRDIPLSAARRAHVVFAGDLAGPFHSPSRGAIDYVAALAMDPTVERIDLHHGGEIKNNMQAYIDERLGDVPPERGLNLISTQENPDYLVDAIRKGPCTYHFWCEPIMAPQITIASRLGPTVMFTCGDEPPPQYADVFWYFHEPQHMAPIWKRRGAPASYIRNYVQSLSGPFYDEGPPAPRARAEVHLPQDAFVIATVGNRLAVDLDETFVTGIEKILRDRPNCIWLVVGGLPDNLLDACQAILGDQFRYIYQDLELARLMTTVDVFANPFRQGGGNSAMIALTAGAVLLTTKDGDVASMAPPEHRAKDPEDYFARLAMLIDTPGALDAWREPQRERCRVMTDQTHFLSALKAMVDLAHQRFEARQGRTLTSVVEED
ncbi:hypothetical protein [Caulobacter sp. UC70_42]|uniref:hypothetical protein n=1 Tax=Caulobacter sp. UC70_42 TaxID=3374551 RepID=UPI00375771BE